MVGIYCTDQELNAVCTLTYVHPHAYQHCHQPAHRHPGVVYEATVVSLPGTVCVINASGGGGDAKVEALFNDMVQLRPDVNNALMRQQEVIPCVTEFCCIPCVLSYVPTHHVVVLLRHFCCVIIRLTSHRVCTMRS